MSEAGEARAVAPVRVQMGNKFEALRRQFARLSWSAFSYRVACLFYASPFYGYFLKGRVPVSLLTIPPDPWPGDATHGASIIAGKMSLSGAMIPIGDDPWDWQRLSYPDLVLAELHGFGWLSDLRTVGGDAARRRARELVASWINAYPTWHSLSWRLPILGARLAAWLSHYEFFCASADDIFRGLFFQSLAQQARHLLRAVKSETDPLSTILALKGALYVVLALPELVEDDQEKLAQLIKTLTHEMEQQIRMDGCYASRTPSHHLGVLRLLIDIRAAFAAGGYEIPSALQGAIELMAPALRHLRHGDGGLAIFNGGSEEKPWIVDMVLSQADARGRARRRIPEAKSFTEGGFERLMAGRMMVMIDAGLPPASGFDRVAHAGTLALEVSVGRDRLIVNCGAPLAGQKGWGHLPRTTAAHSVLIVHNTNSSEILSPGGLGHRPSQVKVIREESEGNIWLDSAHDGYEKRFGLTHRRRLYLAATGEDLRGEDSLEGEGSADFVVRFHLHPKVKAQITQDRHAALLQVGNSGWRFRAAGGELGLEDSVYFGDGNYRRTQQIIIKGRTGEDGRSGAMVKWALRKERYT
ncbi:MAG: heparinase II/III family protein [Alphaproteobacteria bacterium]